MLFLEPEEDYVPATATKNNGDYICWNPEEALWTTLRTVRPLKETSKQSPSEPGLSTTGAERKSNF